MASKVKQAEFDNLHDTLLAVEKSIDAQLDEAIAQNPEKPWDGQANLKSFLKSVERTAIKNAAEELDMSESAVRDRWHILTLPSPVYYALESGEITMSKAKLLTAINWDFESEKESAIAEEIVKEIKRGGSVDSIKAMVTKAGTQVWNSSDITVHNMAKQHGIAA